MKSVPLLARVIYAWVPVAGVGAFIALYLWAASMYPGGTSFDHQTRGWSHLSNYWCDLLDRFSYSGAINPGRPFAILATVVLPLSLIPLWLQVPLLFGTGSISCWIVRIAGSTSMAFSTLVFTQLHDVIIHFASTFGFIAFVATTLRLAQIGRTLLVSIALFSIGLGVTNYIMWQTTSLLWAMPMVQKAAYVAFFIWIIATSHAIHRTIDIA
jgi:hypothetical protein